MAKFTSLLFNSVRGRIGEVVFSMWKGKGVCRKMPTVISQSNCEDQMVARATLAELASKEWNDLTTEEKAAWVAMAAIVKGFPLPPGGVENLVPGLGGDMSGFNCFLGFNSAALQCGAAAVVNKAAPVGEERPDPPTSLSAVVAGNSINLTWVDPVNAVVGAKVRIWARSRGGCYHRQLRTYKALAALTHTLSDLRSAKGGMLTFAVTKPQNILIQLDVVNPSGLRSAGSSTVQVEVV